MRCSQCPYVLPCMAGIFKADRRQATTGGTVAVLLCRACGRLQVTHYELIDIIDHLSNAVVNTDVAVSARRYFHCEKMGPGFLMNRDIPQVAVLRLGKEITEDFASPGGDDVITITTCEECRGATRRATGDRDLYLVEYLDEM